jgi:hypothetical protein
MKAREQICSIALLLSLSFFAYSQTVSARGIVAQLEVPAGNDAWVVQVFTSGGFAGKGAGDFGLTSEGRLICSLPEWGCPTMVQPAQLQRVVDVVQSIVAEPAAEAHPVSLCNDCITTTIVIKRRNTAGIQTTHSVSWDVSTRSSVAADILQLYDALTALRK